MLLQNIERQVAFFCRKAAHGVLLDVQDMNDPNLQDKLTLQWLLQKKGDGSGVGISLLTLLSSHSANISHSWFMKGDKSLCMTCRQFSKMNGQSYHMHELGTG